jgi:hypothetical protein
MWLPRPWLLSVLLALALALPATAHAVWTAPLTLSPAGRNAFHPDVGIDQSGNTVFVWVRRDGTTGCGGAPGCNRIQAVARSAAGALSTVQDVSPPGQHAMLPQVGVDLSGNAVVAWFGHTQLGVIGECTDCPLLTRARAADGTLSTTQTLAPAGEAYNSVIGGVFPALGVDQSGNAVFAWESNDGTTSCGGSGCTVVARARSATGTLSATQVVGGPVALQPDVAVRPDGDAVFVWLRFDPDTAVCDLNTMRPRGCYRVQIRTRSASGALSAIQTLTAEGRDAFAPQVAVDQAGNAVVVWRRHDGTTDCSGSGCWRAQARVRYANGILSPIQSLSAPGEAVGVPEVAVDQAGNAVVAWQRNDGTTGCGSGCNRIQARVRDADGTLSPIQTLSALGQHADSPQVGVDESGNAVFVWEREFPTTNSTCVNTAACVRIQARVRSSNGALSATQTLSAAGRDSTFPQLAVNGAGSAATTWTLSGAPFLRVQAAFGP